MEAYRRKIRRFPSFSPGGRRKIPLGTILGEFWFVYLVYLQPGAVAIPSNPIAEAARKAFFENSQKERADRYRIVFKKGWVKVGRPFMVRSQEDEFVVWVEDGGVEDFRIEQVESFELLPQIG